MFIEYTKLPNNSRVWIYQADREFNIEEIEYICAKAILFIDNWKRHGEDLKASFTIKYNQFLVLAVDENTTSVSGCSIDSSVHFIKELEAELKVDLMNKMNVSFKDGEIINIVKLSEFKQFVKEKKITSATIVFNNMVSTKEDFENNWEVTADKSWHKQFLV